MTKKVYTAEKIFTGHEILHHHAAVTEDGIIEDIIAAANIDDRANFTDFGKAIIAPAFIDLQLYGAAGKLLAVYPDAATVQAIYEYSKSGGAAWCMPTVATHPYEIIFKCIDAVKDYWSNGGKGVLGLHVEGPWISKTKRGAHKEEWIFSPTIQQAKELLDYGKGVIKIITLAPEECADEIIQLVQSYGVIVSAGHSNATYQQAMHAFDMGVPAATHLYNAMSPLQHRAPGLVGACFEHAFVMAPVIPDGHHADYAAIRIAKKIMGERLFAITDAVTETTEGHYKHTLETDKYTANGILSGSALTMNKAAYNLIHHCNISMEEALRMCSLYPAKLLQRNDLGELKQGSRACMAVIADDCSVKAVID